MKKNIAMKGLVFAALLAANTSCSAKLLDYAEGKKVSEGLAFKLASEIEGGFSFGDYVTGDEDYYVCTGIGTCTDAYVVVPSTYNGKSVKAIGDQAFTSKSAPGVKGITLPNSVEAIGSLAFRNWDTSYEYIHANGIRCYGDGSLTATQEDTYVASQSAVYLASMSFFHGKEGASTKLWLPKTVKTIGASVFLDTSYTTILYEGSAEDWNKITFESGEFDAQLQFEYNVAFPGKAA